MPPPLTAILFVLVASVTSAQRCFPDDFLFGSATSAYQVEGAWNEGGRGQSIWDAKCRYDNETECANVADDFYHRYHDDIGLMKDLNLGTFRFSISWPRVMTWDNQSQQMVPNAKGLEFYHALIDDLIDNNIIPVLTIYHWDLPEELNRLSPSAWLNDGMIDHFNAFAELLYTEYGSKVPYWATFNEPLTFINQMVWGKVNTYIAAHNVLRSHAKAVKSFRSFQQKGVVSSDARISIVLNQNFILPYDEDIPEDVRAAEDANQFELGWFLQPIVSGEYPAVMRERVGDRLPTFTDEEKEMLAGSYDLFMLNHYGVSLATYCWTERSHIKCTDLPPGNPADLGVDEGYVPGDSIMSANNTQGEPNCPWFHGYPPAYLRLIKWMHKFDTNADMLMTENGYCGNREIDSQDQLNYFQLFVEQVYKAVVEEKLPVIGYTAWSLLDNYEWGTYEARFGLYYVEYVNQTGSVEGYTPTPQDLARTPRTAAKWYGALARTGCLDDADAAVGQGGAKSGSLEEGSNGSFDHHSEDTASGHKMPLGAPSSCDG